MQAEASLAKASKEKVSKRKSQLGKASQSLVRHLSAIFDLIIRFSGFSRRFQEVQLEASSRRRLRAMRAEMETAAGNWGMMGAEGEDDIEMEEVESFHNFVTAI